MVCMYVFIDGMFHCRNIWSCTFACK